MQGSYADLIGYAVYFAPADIFRLWPWKIQVEQGQIIGIGNDGCAMIAQMENGCNQFIDLDPCEVQRLFLGSVQGEDGKLTQWAFLSEQDLWDFREWGILNSSIAAEAMTVHTSYELGGTAQSLAIHRIAHDVLKNKNTQYQNLSCEKCLHLHGKSPTPIGFCQNCIRNGLHKDHWTGEDSDMLPPIYP